MWTGYQAEDTDMVPVNSQIADAEAGAVLLYPAGLDVDVSMSEGVGSVSNSDYGFAKADDISSSTPATVIQQTPTDAADLCYNNQLQSCVTELELPENGE